MPSALAKNRCVGPGAGCFKTIQPAVDASHGGDRIKVAPGHYGGGIKIDVGVRLIGAGPRKTVIRGGGHVLTVGTYGASHEPRVSIAGVTVTGGVARSSPESVPFVGEHGVVAAGGGIEIPPGKKFGPGATMTIRHSVIAGNRAAPTHSLPLGPKCPGRPHCPFAMAIGGGIDSWGNLRLVRTTVRRNRVGHASGLSRAASDSDGGGIAAEQGSLTVERSIIRSNAATSAVPKGRFAEGGGIFAVGKGALKVTGSKVSANRVSLNTALPDSVDQLAIGGGVQVGGAVSAVRMKRTKVSRNSVRATNHTGSADAESGGFNSAIVDIPFSFTKTVFAGNRVSAVALDKRRGDATVDTGGATLAGTMSGVRVSGNTAEARSSGGSATATGGGGLIFGRMTRSVASGNTARALGPHGRAVAAAGGLEVDVKGLTLRQSLVRNNQSVARGRRGSSRGGGIFDARLYSKGGPLALIGSDVISNAARGSAGIGRRGGGVFVRGHKTKLIRSSLARNEPDQCFGC